MRIKNLEYKDGSYVHYHTIDLDFFLIFFKVLIVKYRSGVIDLGFRVAYFPITSIYAYETDRETDIVIRTIHCYGRNMTFEIVDNI